MIYYCRDCSYKGNKRSAAGQCPACGSNNYRSAKAKQENGDYQQSSPLKLAFLIALWGYLITAIYWKLYT
jgi:predicted ATP-dependent serine protease